MLQYPPIIEFNPEPSYPTTLLQHPPIIDELFVSHNILLKEPPIIVELQDP